MQQLEEIALVEAIRNTFLPGLSMSDAVMFASLIGDVFQAIDAADIFHNSIQEKLSAPHDSASNSDRVSIKPVELSVPSSNEEGNFYKFRNLLEIQKN